MPRPVHLEISADDPERALQFFSQVFGWTATRWEGPMEYWLLSTGQPSEPGIDGGLLRRQDPAMRTVPVLDVPDVDTTLASIVEHGGTIAMPKFAVPGVGYLAYFVDTEANLFGIMQRDEGAA